MDFLITQIIGAIGYSTLALSYFRKDKKKILFMQIIAYIFFIVHYYMLSGLTGSICNIVGLFAMVIIYLFDKYKIKKKSLLIFITIPLLALILIYTYENIYSIFPIIASTIVIISFLTDNEGLIRGIGVVAAICWLIYAIVYKSYVAIVFEIITLISVFIAFVKNNKAKK